MLFNPMHTSLENLSNGPAFLVEIQCFREVIIIDNTMVVVGGTQAFLPGNI